MPTPGSTAVSAWPGRASDQRGHRVPRPGGEPGGREPTSRRRSEAWLLAEILRQGGGAESLSDDLRYRLHLRLEARRQTAGSRSEFPETQADPDPARPDPVRGRTTTSSRSSSGSTGRSPSPGGAQPRPTSPGSWPPSTSRPARSGSPALASRPWKKPKRSSGRLLGAEAQQAERVAAPLPLPFLDADVWTTRMPEGIDRAAIARACTRDRRGLLREPLDPPAAAGTRRTLSSGRFAGRRGAETPWPGPSSRPWSGSASSSGAAPAAVAIYQGYPFDRLRRRLGLDPVDCDTVDPAGPLVRQPPELEELEPDELDDRRLVEAFESAAGLRDDPLTRRFAAELAKRQPAAARATRPDGRLRSARPARRCSVGIPSEALELLDRARSLGTEATTAAASTPGVPRSSRGRAARGGRRALSRASSSSSSSAPQVALDAAETLLDNGHRSARQAVPRPGRELARSAGVRWVEDRVKALHQTRP